MKITSKQQIEQMQGLSVEVKKELCTYLGRAQGRNVNYAIEFSGDDAESLLWWWQQHQAKAAKRSARKKERPERQQQSIIEKCHEVISELATVKGVTVNDVIKTLKEQIDAAREIERAKAESAAQRAAEKVKAFESQHADVITQYEALKAEQLKSESRCSQLGRKKTNSLF